MAQKFRSVRSKLKRADSHIAELQSEIKDYITSRPFELKREAIPPRADEYLVLRTTKPVPDEISAIAGDAIHNIRSALDHLVCDLAKLNGANSVKDVHFPFSRNADDFPRRLKEETRKLASSDRALIAALKPYSGGNNWPAAGFADTEIGCFMKPEVAYAAKTVRA